MIDSALGPGYDYWKSIKSPAEMEMSGGPSIRTLSNNVSGLISYVEVLVTGDSNASKTGDPLGNKFLLQTMSTCRNIMADQKLPESEKNPIIVPRYIYVDNVPDGTIPFITDGADGAKMDGASGLIPGALGNLSAFSPSGFGRSFSMGNHPDCMSITLRTIDNNNNHGKETQYVAISDIIHEIKTANVVGGKAISGIDPCRFKDYKNPADDKVKTKAECEPANTETDSFSSMLGKGSESSSDSSSESSSETSSETSSDESDSESGSSKYKRKKLTASSDKKYDVMSINNNTMFDDVVASGRGAATAYNLPEDTASRIYYAAIAGIGLYMLYRLMKKYNNNLK